MNELIEARYDKIMEYVVRMGYEIDEANKDDIMVTINSLEQNLIDLKNLLIIYS